MIVLQKFLQFHENFDMLKSSAQKLFLQGKITFSEAQTFSALPRSVFKRTKAQFAKSHALRHDPLKRQFAGLDYAVDTVHDLDLELDRMPQHITSAVLEGSMTLIQARYAYRRNFGGQPVVQICRANMPKVSRRLRPRPMPSEISVRKLNIRNRTHLAARAR